EYSHLWSEALEQANPKAWEQLKNDLVKDTELMDYVKGLYPEIEDENELMHEVFAHFSGKRGRARLEEMRKEETEKANGLLDKARIIAIFHRLKELLGRYWTMARDLFAGSVKGLKKMKAEDFADMAMADLLGGFNPGAAAKNATAKKDAAYMEAVKNGDMETAQKMVDEAAKKAMPNTKVVDESGNPLVVFHGTTEDFTVFDHTKARTNMDIQGMFFSPWELDAKGYGGNTRGFYLNITNPASFGVGLAALRKFQGQNGAGTKAREYLIEQGYDGVNNDNEEYIAFYPEQIKSADAVTYDDNGNVIPLSERFNKENNDIRYQFVGEQGATEADKAEGVITRIESLATAKQMEADGRPAINIKMATGWERGKDGKWRYETEDFDVSHDSWEKAWEMGDGEYVLLPELIGKDDILFKEYPDLANVKVYPNRRISEGGYYSHPNEIHVSAKNTDNVKIFRSTLLHEVQHAIQHREGFERGTNWEKYTLDASADELHIAYLIREEAEKLVDSGEYKRLGNAINHVASLWEENGWYNPRVDKDGFYYAIGLAHDYEADLLNEMSLPKAQYEAKEKYLRNAGEVEARNVQTRASMTAKERRRTLAEETEDYLRGEQIVTNGDAGGSASVVEDKDEVARLEAEQGAAEAVKMHYDALAQKYHGKPYRIVMSIDEMADEDFLKEMGKTEEDLSG
ncbi:MAG: hypothetical protein J6V61_01725, partial [Bacteroidaceae bacterium]|nr:hypothetical protein [Bacteroidaceae bacterium]